MFLSRKGEVVPCASGRAVQGVVPLVALVVLASILVLGSGIAPGLASADLKATPARTFVTNGPVNAVVPTTRAIYIGGSFDRVGPGTGPGVGIDTSTAKSTGLPEIAGGVSIVRAVVPDGSGGFYVGGNFTHVGTLHLPHLAHILPDGQVDPNFHPNPESSGGYGAVAVNALVLSGKTLYVGGRFTSIGGKPRNFLAALDATTGRATSWNPDVQSPLTAGAVHALAVSGGTVYAGGFFDSSGGKPRRDLAAVDATTGRTTDWNPSPDRPVYALAVAGQRVYAGGNFRSIGGQQREFLAALNATTGQTMAWDPNANNIVKALAVSGSTVYAGGYFTSIGGQQRSHVAALEAATANATAWSPNPRSPSDSGGVDALAVSGSTVYVGGDFSWVGGQAGSDLAAVDANSGKVMSWDPKIDGGVDALAVSGRTVYAGGRFTSIASRRRNSLAALDPKTGAVTSWNPGVQFGNGGPTGIVRALALSGHTLYAGGEFSSVGNMPRSNLAAIDATTGQVTDWNPGYDRGIFMIKALAVSGPIVYAAGFFDSIGGAPRHNIAALHASTGNATGWNPNVNGGVSTIALAGQTVYAGGYFYTVGGQARKGLAAIDTTTGNVTGWDPNASPSSGTRAAGDTLAVSGPTVYAGGYFDLIGGQARHAFAALDAATGKATSFDPNPQGGYVDNVQAVVASGRTVYAGGNFTSIGGQPRHALAALDAATGKATSWNPTTSGGGVTALAIGPDGSLWAGGSFTGFGTVAQAGIARFAP